jgi:hypothetical protein
VRAGPSPGGSARRSRAHGINHLVVPAVTPRLPVAALAATTAGAASIWIAAPTAEGWVLVAAALATTGAATIVAEAVRRAGWLGGALSPAGVVALALVILFALRPLALVEDRARATPGLAALGFAPADVLRAEAIGIVGLSCFALPLLALLPARPRPNASRLPAASSLAVAIAVAAIAGTVLWGTLFLRIGGFHVLLHDPALLHLRQFGGIYGVFGLLLCLGGALVGIAGYVWTRSRPVLVAAAAAASCALAGSICLASRGPLLATMVALAVVVAGRLSRRQAALALCGVLVIGIALVLGRAVRERAQTEPVRGAIWGTLRESPLQLIGGDLTDFDHFVALTELVPHRLGWLYGRSLAYVPAAFVPRQLWGSKPRPIDYRLSEQLYEGARAGTPFTLPGELYWNFGAAGVALGMAALGALYGLLWRLVASGRTAQRHLLAALLVGFTYLLLTRPLAPMVQTTTVAAVALFSVLGLGRLTERLRPAASKQPAHR